MHSPGTSADFLIDKCSLVLIMDINPISQLQSAAALGPDLGGESSLSLSSGHIEEKRAGLKSGCNLIVLVFLRP